MASDAQIPAEPPVDESRKRLLAPWWHTLILVAMLLLASLNGTRGKHPLAEASGGKVPEYVATMVWEWMLVGFIWLGIRKRVRLRELIGGRWATWEEFFLDVVYAAAFWGCALFVLGSAAKMMHLDQGGKIEAMRKSLGFLVPGTRLELGIWFCTSATAGFCEEIIFRGYLQRQFAAIANSMLVGVIASALVFGASHGYEGVARMVLIAIYGLMFGLLAWWRKSLRPGMIAHAWHDALSGAVLRMLR
ncbi:MAG TPA: CPBP family intramembrane glutamic endopeptidase [Bryocella sp.]|nr:CPBP family intramembrane glutamic endopeptidase [Bryocella sp.]